MLKRSLMSQKNPHERISAKNWMIVRNFVKQYNTLCCEMPNTTYLYVRFAVYYAFMLKQNQQCSSEKRV